MATRRSVPYPLENVYLQRLGVIALIVILCIMQIRFTIRDPRHAVAAELGGATPLPSQPVYAAYMGVNMWEYLRSGLNYVESSGEEYPVDFVHPGGVAYGPLALTHIAIQDVIQRCDSMSGRTVEEILSDRRLYEDVARCYADLLLRHYLKLEYWTMNAESVFDILQKAWFLGPGLYQRAQPVPSSRKRNAEEYVEKMKRLAKKAEPLSSPIAGPLIVDVQTSPDQISAIMLDD